MVKMLKKILQKMKTNNERKEIYSFHTNGLILFDDNSMKLLTKNVTKELNKLLVTIVQDENNIRQKDKNNNTPNFKIKNYLK